ncbi:cell division protein FtsB [Elusimicrobium simillimum]|uniref:hypothetical protein n=1 Tax=Elusimicrobium simillimum TaxID=3143438 RepID=UPI003C704789
MKKLLSIALSAALFITSAPYASAQSKKDSVALYHAQLQTIKDNITDLRTELDKLEAEQKKTEEKIKQQYKRNLKAGMTEETAEEKAKENVMQASLALAGDLLMLPGRMQANIAGIGPDFNVKRDIKNPRLLEIIGDKGYGVFATIMVAEAIIAFECFDKAKKLQSLKWAARGAGATFMIVTSVAVLASSFKTYSDFNHPATSADKKVEMLLKNPDYFASQGENLEDTAMALMMLFEKHPEMMDYMYNYTSYLRYQNKYKSIPVSLFWEADQVPADKLTRPLAYSLMVKALYRAEKRAENVQKQYKNAVDLNKLTVPEIKDKNTLLNQFQTLQKIQNKKSK